jgi:hypothetical protein
LNIVHSKKYRLSVWAFYFQWIFVKSCEIVCGSYENIGRRSLSKVCSRLAEEVTIRCGPDFYLLCEETACCFLTLCFYGKSSVNTIRTFNSFDRIEDFNDNLDKLWCTPNVMVWSVAEARISISTGINWKIHGFIKYLGNFCKSIQSDCFINLCF